MKSSLKGQSLYQTMKPMPVSLILAATLLWSAAPPCSGQGTVIFNNRIFGTIITRVYSEGLCFSGNGPEDFPTGLVDWDAFTKIQGSRFAAQLLAAPGADRPLHELVPALPVTTFRTGLAAGNVAGVTATLPSVPADAPVSTVQMVVWDNSTGFYPNWTSAQAAWLSGLIIAGSSPKFNVYAIGGFLNGAPALTNLVSFSFTYPEGSGRPWIFLHPQSQTVQAARNVSFTVGASTCTPDGFPYLYQWRFHGTNLPGATTSSLTIFNAQFYHEGEYRAEVRARPWTFSQWGNQSTTSSPALLQLQPGPRPQLRMGSRSDAYDGRSFRFTLLGTPGVVYRLEASTNLVDWVRIQLVTNHTSRSDIILPVDTSSPSFFRAF